MMRKFSPVFSIWITSMKPVGNLLSVLTLPSILMRRCFMMVCTSFMVRAYFRRFLRKMEAGRDSDILWGPELDLGANTPPSLASIHALGALRRFKCSWDHAAYFNFSCRSESSN